MTERRYIKFYSYNREDKAYAQVGDTKLSLSGFEPWQLKIPATARYYEVYTTPDSIIPLERVHLVETVFDHERAEFYNQSMATHMRINNISHACFLGNGGANSLFIPKPGQHIYMMSTRTDFTVPENRDLSAYVNDRVPENTGMDEDTTATAKTEHDNAARDIEPDIRRRIEPQIIPVRDDPSEKKGPDLPPSLIKIPV